MTDLAAIILAAGRSRRMGKFKPLLPFGNQTVIEACVNNLRSAGLEDIVVAVGHRAEDVRAQLASAAVTFVTNPNPDSEMSDSIALAVGGLSGAARAVLLTPADYPAVSPSIVEVIIARWRAGAKLVQPEFEGKGGHPVLIDISYREELLHLDDASGLRGFLARHRLDVLRLAVQSPFVARDMDTWEDYCELHQAVFGQKPEKIADPDELNG